MRTAIWLKWDLAHWENLVVVVEAQCEVKE